jgi:hypothetical protein
MDTNLRDYKFQQQWLESHLGKSEQHWEEHRGYVDYSMDVWKYGKDVLAVHWLGERHTPYQDFTISRKKLTADFVTEVLKSKKQ